jgi:hypothetical protein
MGSPVRESGVARVALTLVAACAGAVAIVCERSCEAILSIGTAQSSIVLQGATRVAVDGSATVPHPAR